MKKSSILIIVSIAVIFLFLKVVVAKATSCGGVPLGAPAGGTYTINDLTAPGGGCTFAYTVDGIEQGNIRIAANYTLTINRGQTVVWNPGYSVIIDGSIAINKGTPGGQLKKTYIWAKDIDNDGYLDETQPFVAQDSNPGGGSKRRYQLTSWPSSFDCDDTALDKWQYLNCYPDLDSDGYYAMSSTSTCGGTSCPTGYSATPGNDCCDLDNNAKPGQTLYFTIPNACGSWDYDCDSTTTKDENCVGGASCNLDTLQTTCVFYNSLDRTCVLALLIDDYWLNCTINTTTQDCGVSWSSYFCNPNPCGDTECGGVITIYNCPSSSKTCGCR